ncbi:hypothetical protein CRV24_003908 [Beauveria bassiana]|nr:hypothetical protein CRV24_003908 [Beauveria bassiana]
MDMSLGRLQDIAVATAASAPAASWPTATPPLSLQDGRRPRQQRAATPNLDPLAYTQLLPP